MPDIYFKAIEKWGAEAQVKMMIEECGKLITALMHYDRGRNKPIDVCGEIADVEIMVNQMKVLFGPKCEDIKKYKLERLKERIER